MPVEKVSQQTRPGSASYELTGREAATLRVLCKRALRRESGRSMDPRKRRTIEKALASLASPSESQETQR